MRYEYKQQLLMKCAGRVGGVDWGDGGKDGDEEMAKEEGKRRGEQTRRVKG